MLESITSRTSLYYIFGVFMGVTMSALGAACAGWQSWAITVLVGMVGYASGSAAIDSFRPPCHGCTQNSDAQHG